VNRTRTDDQGKGEDLGLGLKPGAEQYRAFVGPPADYDLVAAMSFSLLTALGLRQQHRILDVGCGSLRVGRLLIPYLNRGGYVGIEPNGWLIEEGVQREIGADLVRIKAPYFHVADSTAGLPPEAAGPFDFALAQSVFSHTGRDLLERWVKEIAALLGPAGALAATYLPAPEDARETGWVYPACVRYRPETLSALARSCGLTLVELDWRHPRQKWLLLARSGFDLGWLRKYPLGWNSRLDFGPSS
jgi:SAM-dependent methyltransferase